MTFFIKMALLIAATIFFSFVFSFAFFMAALAVVGPQEKEGDISWCCRKITGGKEVRGRGGGGGVGRCAVEGSRTVIPMAETSVVQVKAVVAVAGLEAPVEDGEGQ